MSINLARNITHRTLC